jgi:hypothetical protein
MKGGHIMLRSFTGRGSGRPTGRSINCRQASDRRSWAPAHVPLIESNGQLVLFDRRNRPDRRLSNIILTD